MFSPMTHTQLVDQLKSTLAGMIQIEIPNLLLDNLLTVNAQRKAFGLLPKEAHDNL
jgi:hypothetical protein